MESMIMGIFLLYNESQKFKSVKNIKEVRHVAMI